MLKFLYTLIHPKTERSFFVIGILTLFATVGVWLVFSPTPIPAENRELAAGFIGALISSVNTITAFHFARKQEYAYDDPSTDPPRDRTRTKPPESPIRSDSADGRLDKSERVP